MHTEMRSLLPGYLKEEPGQETQLNHSLHPSEIGNSPGQLSDYSAQGEKQHLQHCLASPSCGHLVFSPERVTVAEDKQHLPGSEI